MASLASRIRRRISDDAPQRKLESSPSDDPKGPKGLNLLFEPDDPLVDFIFVHGLGGGSRKTWTKNKKPETFWPREWLPADEDNAFESVRIHSFGYNADWATMKETHLNFTDFGKDLAQAIKFSPKISRGPRTPIVLIAHSMGGLVIKEAYLLSQNDKSMEDVFSRFRTMVFLATPHKGSNMAETLNVILRYSFFPGMNESVRDLGRNTAPIQRINEAFSKGAGDLELFSFYETVETKTPWGGNIMIVEKDSAILGWPAENTTPMNTDHRGICKFDRTSDPSYRTVRNILAAITTKLTKELGKSASSGSDDQIRRLETYIAIADDPDKDLTSLQEAHMDGSCDWLLSREYFEDWRDSDLPSLTFLWLRGLPGVGKSVLSANIVSYFRKQNLNPAFHFFKHGDKAKATVGSLLRSIAFQMAAIYPAVKARLLRMQQENISFDEDDEGVIWRKLFLECIFKVKLKSPLFWIIDALDECSNTNAFFNLVAKRDCPVPIRVLVTSRPSGTFLKKFTDLGNATSVRAEDISTEDTLEDIRQYVTFKLKDHGVDDETDRQYVESQVLAKSDGSFLWVKLIMNQLHEAHMIEDFQSLVQGTPPAMEDLYRDVLTSISASLSTSSQTRELAIAIFTWTACATRPFTLEELKTVLIMDMGKEKFFSLRTSISSLCGQLIYIDKHDRVQMVHETARQFILKRSESILGIEEKRCHARLAEVCLSYLAGPDMAPAQSRKRSSATSLTPRSMFMEYASLSFAEHVRGTNSWNVKVLRLLHEFLTTNVQVWIEFIARTGNLQHLVKAAKHFRNFLDRAAKHHPPTRPGMQDLERWSTDLIRLVAKFGRNLLLVPTSIYGLIPPFCPKDSALGKQFGSSWKGMTVEGLSALDWDDRLSVMQYAKDVRSTTVAYGPRHFAVGLSIGEIIAYNVTTCQESIKYQLGQKVRFIVFGSKKNLLAASGRSEIRVWDTESGVLLHSYQTSDEALALAFSEADTRLMTATRGHTVVSYDLGYESKPDIYPWLDDEEMNGTEFRRLPIGLEFSPDQSLLAIVYKGFPILIWDIEDEAPLGECDRLSRFGPRRASMHLLIIAMVFNPATKQLAAAYGDGDIAVFDYETQEPRLLISAEADAQALACSPNGLTLATGDAFGTIQLRDFESLELLYTLSAYDDPIHALVFSPDSLRFLDIRGSKCNLWEPAALVREVDDDDDQSMSGTAMSEAPFQPQESKVSTAHHIVLVTALVSHSDGNTIFVAKDDGSVSTYIHDPQTGQQIKLLYSHSNDSDISVTRLTWGSKRLILCSADVSTRLKAWQLSQDLGGIWHTKVQLLDIYLNNSITQILLNPENNLIMVSTATSDGIYTLGGDLIQANTSSATKDWKWVNHPSDPRCVISVSPSSAHVYLWSDFTERSAHTLTMLPTSPKANLTIRTIIPIPKSHLAVEVLESGPTVSRTHLQLFTSSSFGAPSVNALELASPVPKEPTVIQPLPSTNFLSPCFERLIALTTPSTLVFLDTNLWVCTIDLRTFTGKEYTRHFFLPYDWLSASGHGLLMDVVGRWDVACVKGDEVAVVRKGIRGEGGGKVDL